MWPFRRQKRSDLDLSTPLLMLSKHDYFTLGDAFEGVLVLGATGSGKSSGSGKALAQAYLAAGFGALVLTAKPDDAKLMESYCRKAGRLSDLRIFSPSGPFRFNPFDYELRREGAGAGYTENLVHLFAEVMQITERSSGQGGREDDGYFRRAGNQLLRNAIDLLVMAKGRLCVRDLYRLVISAPTSLEQVGSEAWQRSSFCCECLNEADARVMSAAKQRDFELVTDYLCVEWPALSSRTRSVVQSTLTSMLDTMNRGVLADLFSSGTNIVPEDIANGAVVVVDLPVKEFGEIGLIAQILLKTAFQRSMERRSLAQYPLPVLLFADEAQCFITAHDQQFQTTCRSSRVATIYLTQNVSNVYAALGGGDLGKAQADSLFANLNTKIFHANGDPVTNEWAASLIGRSRQFLTNSSSTHQPESGFGGFWGSQSEPQTTAGVSEHIDFEVQPRRFTTLRRGGPVNHWEVDGIVFQGGRRFRKTGRTWMPVTFSQRG